MHSVKLTVCTTSKGQEEEKKGRFSGLKEAQWSRKRKKGKRSSQVNFLDLDTVYSQASKEQGDDKNHAPECK